MPGMLVAEAEYVGLDRPLVPEVPEVAESREGGDPPGVRMTPQHTHTQAKQDSSK